jgi:hypothetical protein
VLVQDVRDIRIYSNELKRFVHGSSAFFKRESVSVPHFACEHVAALFQHTATIEKEVFSGAIDCLMEITNGQPVCESGGISSNNND